MRHSTLTRRRVLVLGGKAAALAAMMSPSRAPASLRPALSWRRRFARDLRTLESRSPLTARLRAVYQQRTRVTAPSAASIAYELESLYERRGSLSDWVSARSRREFQNGQVVSVDGLMISVTEDRLFTFAVLET